jgi:hypothetical protein
MEGHSQWWTVPDSWIRSVATPVNIIGKRTFNNTIKVKINTVSGIDAVVIRWQ